jgi:hypothetical protein
VPGIAELIAQAARRYGVDPAALLATAKIESGLNPNARNPNSSAGGLFQFIDSTAQQYGLRNKFDAAAAADAGARLMADNTAFLRSRGLPVTPTSLYLAHQQGPAGAAKILANPEAPLASLVGDDAARLNAGSGKTAGAFADMFGAKVMHALGDAPVGPAAMGASFAGQLAPAVAAANPSLSAGEQQSASPLSVDSDDNGSIWASLARGIRQGARQSSEPQETAQIAPSQPAAPAAALQPLPVDQLAFAPQSQAATLGAQVISDFLKRAPRPRAQVPTDQALSQRSSPPFV